MSEFDPAAYGFVRNSNTGDWHRKGGQTSYMLEHIIWEFDEDQTLTVEQDGQKVFFGQWPENAADGAIIMRYLGIEALNPDALVSSSDIDIAAVESVRNDDSDHDMDRLRSILQDILITQKRVAELEEECSAEKSDLKKMLRDFESEYILTKGSSTLRGKSFVVTLQDRIYKVNIARELCMPDAYKVVSFEELPSLSDVMTALSNHSSENNDR